jgi:hypothetical protein
MAAPSPLWRWLITDLCGAGLTLIDHLAAERTVIPKLNEPLEMTGTVPSDNSEINRLHTDGYPFLAEGVRELYGFRNEWNPIYELYEYNIRASTLILQTTDAAASDDARTRFSAFDAWQYLFYQPIYVSLGETSGLIPREGYSYTGMTASEIIYDMWLQGISNRYWPNYPDPPDPCAPYYYFLTLGTLQVGPVIDTWRVEPGTSMGQAWQDLCAAGYCDIVFTPIYDPVGLPGILNEVNVYAQTPNDNASGAGVYQYDARMTWDMPGNSMVGADNLYDGTQRANIMAFSRGQAGTYVDQQADVTSLATYGEYWAFQYFPEKQYDKVTVEDIAREQLYLRAMYKQTFTAHPAPERAPEPFRDYNIGDRVPVGVSQNLRQPLPPWWPGPPISGDDTLVWQRVYGIPVDIDDNGTETVRELLVGPIGNPPPVTGPGNPGFRSLGTTADTSGLTTAVETAGGSGVRTLRRSGRIQVITPFRQGVL